MENIKVIGIDLAKNVFQIAGLNGNNEVVFNKKVSRQKLTVFVANLPRTTIAMEACGSANYWARKFVSMGHEIRLIPAQHVKAFVRGQNKNDAKDAVAICEASLRPGIHFVPVKTVEQQDLQMLHRIRQGIVDRRTALANQIRAYLRENGIAIPVQMKRLLQELPLILEEAENGLSHSARQMINLLLTELTDQKKRLDVIDQEIQSWIQRDAQCQRLHSIPGFGPIVTTALISAIGNGTQFKNGRGLSAWLGLTPRQHGSGGKTKLLETTKMGNSYLRYLLIHGARTVVRWCANKNDRLSRWIRNLIARRGKHKAIVALANKCARIAWALLTRQQTFQLKEAFV